MSDALFIGSNTKLLRAKELIKELENEFNKFNNNDPVTIKPVIVDNNITLQVNWKGLPLKVGSILGDVIHNLRSSLDLLAVELVKINRENPKNVYFPFSSTEMDLDVQIKNKNFHKAGPKAIEILKKIKPYSNGNKLLRALHDLDIDDKHKHLLDTEKTMEINISGQYRIDDMSSLAINYNCETISHFFENESKLAGFPIIETLNKIYLEINEIIDKFKISIL